MSKDKQITEDKILKDDSLQSLASTLTDMKSMFTSLQAEVQALKTSSQTQDKNLITDYKDMDTGADEFTEADLAKKGAATSFDYVNMTRNKKIDGDGFSTIMTALGGIIAQHVTSVLSDERVYKEDVRSQRLRHADIAIAGQWGDVDKVKELEALRSSK